MGFIKKLKHKYIWKRIFYERLTEPLHLNIISIFVYLFGSYKLKSDFDLILRPQHAFSLFKVAEIAANEGKNRATIIEFGVANGAGLYNIQNIAEKVTKHTGIKFDIYGFDTGEGMPPPSSFKDHPDLYSEGDFPMDFKNLQNSLNENTKLIIGKINKTLPEFMNQSFEESPISFISIDVDYYSSTIEALDILKMQSNQYLSKVVLYLDDLEDDSHNSWCGELAAINEFSDNSKFRKIEKHAFLRSNRIFKNAKWIDHIFYAHILDHEIRNKIFIKKNKTILENPLI